MTKPIFSEEVIHKAIQASNKEQKAVVEKAKKQDWEKRLEESFNGEIAYNLRLRDFINQEIQSAYKQGGVKAIKKCQLGKQWKNII
jgi:hypothetical protein